MSTPHKHKVISREINRDLLLSGKYGIKIVQLRKRKPPRYKKDFLKECQV